MKYVKLFEDYSIIPNYDKFVRYIKDFTFETIRKIDYLKKLTRSVPFNKKNYAKIKNFLYNKVDKGYLLFDFKNIDVSYKYTLNLPDNYSPNLEQLEISFSKTKTKFKIFETKNDWYYLRTCSLDKEYSEEGVEYYECDEFESLLHLLYTKIIEPIEPLQVFEYYNNLLKTYEIFGYEEITDKEYYPKYNNSTPFKKINPNPKDFIKKIIEDNIPNAYNNVANWQELRFKVKVSDNSFAFHRIIDITISAFGDWYYVRLLYNGGKNVSEEKYYECDELGGLMNLIKNLNIIGEK